MVNALMHQLTARSLCMNVVTAELCDCSLGIGVGKGAEAHLRLVNIDFDKDALAGVRVREALKHYKQSFCQISTRKETCVMSNVPHRGISLILSGTASTRRTLWQCS